MRAAYDAIWIAGTAFAYMAFGRWDAVIVFLRPRRRLRVLRILPYVAHISTQINPGQNNDSLTRPRIAQLAASWTLAVATKFFG